MACPINAEEISKLKMFVQFASAQPQILNMPQLEFFKKFVEQLGGECLRNYWQLKDEFLSGLCLHNGVAWPHSYLSWLQALFPKEETSSIQG